MKVHGKPEVKRKGVNAVKKSPRNVASEKIVRTTRGSAKKQLVTGYVIVTAIATAVGLGSVWEPWMVHLAWPFSFATLATLGVLATSDVA